MSYIRPKIIVITGPKGSDSSTLCLHVQTSLQTICGPGRVAVASIWDGLHYNDFVLEKSKAVGFLNTLKGVTRTLFIFHCMSLAIDIAYESEPAFMIVDGFWYKYAVAEIEANVPMKVVLAATAGFEIPDLTFFLDPAIGARNLPKANAILNELKFSEAISLETTRNSNEEEKNRAGIWQEIATQNGPWVHLNAGQSPEFLATTIVNKILPKKRFPKPDYEQIQKH